jgi:hypothetical protein
MDAGFEVRLRGAVGLRSRRGVFALEGASEAAISFDGSISRVSTRDDDAYELGLLGVLEGAEA